MTTIVWRHLTSSSTRSSKLVLAGGAIGAAVLYQHLLGSIEHGADRDGPGGLIGPLIAIGASLALAILNVDRRYADVWVPLRVLMWGTGLVVFVQALFDAFHPAAFQSNVFIGIFPDARLLIGMCALAGVIALWRPAFLLPMFLAYCAFRYRVPTLFRLPTPSVDFATIVDVGQFPAFVLNVLWLGGRVAPLQSFLGSNEIRIEKLLWAVGVGVHVGNYFHSGLAKVWASGPDPFFWVFHNPVQQAVAIGLFRMSNPLAAWPSALFAYTVTLSNVAIAINIVVLAAQIFAPIGLLRRRWLIGLTLFFDAMHIGIYLSLGAFFFFWIALNVVILASLALMNDRDFSVTLRGTAMFCALVGFMSFSTATLGWLDGKKVVRETFVADTTNGDSVIVPPAAYGLFSYQIGHGDLYVPAGHFPVRFGANVDWPDWIDGSTCGPMAVSHDQIFMPLTGVRAMVTAADRFYREHPWIKRWNLFYTYPHHMPSNPHFFRKYAATPISEITSYSYIVESACVEMVDGRLAVDTRKRSVVDVDR